MPQVRELRIRQPLGQLAGIDERRHQGRMAFDPPGIRPSLRNASPNRLMTSRGFSVRD